MNNNFCDGAAEAATCLAFNLDSNAIQFMQEGFGRSMQIKLPVYQLVDTRMITANSNTHHNNNHLSASGSISNHPVPGMVDRLHPDYSSMSEEFLATSRSGKTLAQTLM